MASNIIDSKQKSKISAAEFAAKCKSEREIYNMLTIEGKAYLPKYETITICKYFIF